MEINKQQIEAVSNLHREERYEHFISQIVDWEEVWYLQCKEAYYDNKNKCLFLWPAREYAVNYSNKLNNQCTPKKVNLDELLENILSRLNLESYRVEVFPTIEDKGKIIEIKEFIDDIEEECEKY